MKKHLWCVLFVMGLVEINVRQTALADLSVALDIFKVTRAVVHDLLKVWQTTNPKDVPLPSILKNPEDQLLLTMDSLTNKLNSVEKIMSRNAEGINDLIAEKLPHVIRYELRYNELINIVQEIDRKDILLKAYLRDNRQGNQSALLDALTKSIISHEGQSILNLWHRLHTSYMSPTNEDTQNSLSVPSIFSQVARAVTHKQHKSKDDMINLCGVNQSPMQMIYNMYTSLQITQLKAYSMMQFSWIYRRIKDNNSEYSEEAQIIHDIYLENLKQQAKTVKNAMKGVGTEYWHCDPDTHIQNETYTYLRHFLQGYLQNEVDLNDKQTCSENCAYYKFSKQYSCFEGTYCRSQKACKGNLVNCEYEDSDMMVCASENTSTQDRRYDWIKYENGKILGNSKGICKQNPAKVDSWWRWIFWHCSYCFCICDEINSPYTERYFSLRSVQADVKSNMILTGIKIIKRNKVIYLQGKESQLLPKAAINESSTRWIPVEEIDVDSQEYMENIEYYKMTWNQRAIDLDDIQAPKEYLLTGVRWRKLGTHLNFEIRACKFNFTSGLLERKGQNCHWISNDNTDSSLKYPRKMLQFGEADLPTRINAPSKLLSTSDMYIEITHSGKEEDAAQTAVPFFDLQPVSPEPPVPLTGAGIYHKGLYKSGGFIAPKVFSIDFKEYIDYEFPDTG